MDDERTPLTETKKCTACGETKPITSFWKDAGAKDGVQRRCSVCCRAGHRRYRETGTTQKRKTCTSCWNAFPLSEFYKDRTKPGGRERCCKACSNERRDASLKTQHARAPERKASYTVEHAPGSKGWAEMEKRNAEKYEDACARLRAHREEARR